ncbi:MAG: DUF4269 domain-containing protein [Saprospirales bacterium]|nr:MAG: DUF4269 domain-containing protein [Saprospirales bacterium]
MCDDVKKFLSPNYLATGNSTQRQAYKTLAKLEIFERLKDYQPILAGTVPIGLDIEGSDLDILCRYYDINQFREVVVLNYGECRSFQFKEKWISGRKTAITRFQTDDFPVEIFAQSVPSSKQHAFIHMINEYKILKWKGASFKEKVIGLKRSGMKTEPAFAFLMEVNADPYLWLLNPDLQSPV